jgi:hypothetical protein
MPRAYMAMILVVEAGEAPLVLGDEQRLERTIPVARHVDAQRAVLGQHGLATRAVALVAHGLGLDRAIRVAEVMAELGAQGTLDQCLLERHRRGVDGLAGHRPTHELVKQFLGDLRQRRGLRRDRRVPHLRLADRHTCS